MAGTLSFPALDSWYNLQHTLNHIKQSRTVAVRLSFKAPAHTRR